MIYEPVLNCVGESCTADVQPFGKQLEQSEKVSERVVEKDPLDASSVAHSSEHASTVDTQRETCCRELDRVCTESSNVIEAASLRGNVGVLGPATRAETKKVRAEIPPVVAINLRAVDVCRLLNSTPLGTVLDERQIYRHRLRAGFRIQEGRRLNLLRYTAWLCEVRHTRIDERNDPVPRPGPITAAKVLKLLEYQRYRCALTGRKLTPATSALDHVLPISRNGSNNIENAQVLHSDVNRAKGALTNEEL